MENENIYQKIQEALSQLPANFSILEEEIDIDEQRDYFNVSQYLKQNPPAENILEEAELLYNAETSLDSKKQILSKLALLEDVKAYRIIEKYVHQPERELHKWAVLALQESRMLIEASLVDEPVAFISTGLGGRGRMLRYFIVTIAKEPIPFSDIQKKIVVDEFSYSFKQHGAELEETHCYESFVTFSALISVDQPLQQIFEQALRECNEYNNFLREELIITNVKKLAPDEIIEIIERQEEDEDY
ncbi:hypothetical protein EYV94_01885 [Puteibacter caeruleilacunae]|nr:hypothetical protein EYV94_01885 [Puteibacter caeruleilacunae]